MMRALRGSTPIHLHDDNPVAQLLATEGMVAVAIEAGDGSRMRYTLDPPSSQQPRWLYLVRSTRAWLYTIWQDQVAVWIGRGR